MKNVYFWIASLLISASSMAQITLNTTVGSTGYTGSNSCGTGSAGTCYTTFAIQNTSTSPIQITEVGQWTTTANNANTVALYSSTTSLGGTVTGAFTPTAPPAGWSLAASGTISGITTTGVNTVLSGLNIVVPGGTTIRFVLLPSGTVSYSGTGVGTASPNTFSSNGINLLVGDVQLGGGFVGLGGVNNPRFFTGSVSYVPLTPCAGAPTGGTTNTTATAVCPLQNFGLSLSGATLAAGISYQWESSSTGTGNWTPIAGATISTYSASQTVDTYYRCALTCANSSLTSYSTPVQVTTLPNLAAGTYTIGAGGTYLNFTQAFQAASCGVAGPVVFNVLPGSGPYVEQIILGQIPGMSATNTITVNGNGALLTFKSTNTNERAVLKLNGTDFITFKNLSIRAQGNVTTNFGFGVQLMNGANNVTFKNCQIAATDSSTSLNFSSFVCSNTATSATGGGTAASNLLIDSCTIVGGYYGVTLGGTSATKVGLPSNNIVRNTLVKDFYLYGIYASGQNNLLVRNNIVNRASRFGTQSTFYGISVLGRQLGSRIESNRIHDPHGSTTVGTYSQYAIYASSASGALNQPLVIANNAVYNFNTVGGVRGGLYLFTTDSARIYHNTFNFDNQLATGTSVIYGLYLSGACTDFQLRNNVFNITETSTGIKYMLYYATANAVVNSNNNVYNFTGAGGTSNNFGYRNAAAVPTMSAWTTATGQDAASIIADPIFVSPTTGDLTPNSSAINNAGANVLSVVPTDINNNPRIATSDPGAFEYTPAGCPTPFGLAASNTGSTTTNLTWNGTNAGYEVQWGPVGFTPGTGTVLNTATNSAAITGLTPYTQYHLYVRGTCVSQSLPPSMWNGPVTILTAIAPVWAENFASGYDPTVQVPKPMGWSELNGLLANPTVVVTTTSAWMEDGWLNSGTAGAVRNQVPNTSNNTFGYTITPSIDLGTGPHSFFLKFNMALTAANAAGTAVMGNDDSVMVVISTNNGQTWNRSNAIAKWHKNSGISNTGSTYFVPLAGYTGLVKLAFYIESTVNSASQGATNYDLFVDDVEITNVTPTCPDPSLAHTATPTSITVSKSYSVGTGSTFAKYYWGPAGFLNSTGGTGGTYVNFTGSNFTLNGLTPNTSYDIYVRDSCGATSFSAWVGPLNVKTPCLSTLAGTYTVNATGSGTSNFTTLSNAVQSLTSCGISAPVTFNIAAGSYTGEFTLTDFPGSTPLRTVTFNGGSPSLVTVTAPLGSGAVFTLDNAKNIAFKNMRLINTLGGVIRFINNSDSNVVEGNLIISDTTGTAVSAAVFSSASLTSPTTLGSEVDYITIKNNIIKGGYYGIALSGISTTSFDKGFLIEGNTLLKQYFYGMRLYALEDMVVKNNRFDQSRIASSYGMYVYYTRNVDIVGNFMNAGGYGLYMYYPNYQITGAIPANQITNNMLRGSTYGFYAYSLRDYNFYHNTCVGGTYGYYLSGIATVGQEIRNLNLKNNIFTGNTYPIYIVTAFTAAQNCTLDYNAYQAGTSGLAYYGAARATLAAWQTAFPALNANSAAGTVLYTSASDFHIVGAFPNDLGQPGLGVTVDIDGDQRPANGSTNPDMGADEFTPIANDAKVVALNGVGGGCGDSATTAQVVVENMGLNPITSMPVTVIMEDNNGVQTPVTVNFSGAIAPLGVQTIAVGPFNTYLGGVKNFKAYTSLANDGRANNDTVVKLNSNFYPVEPIVVQDSIDLCPSVAQVTLAAVPYTGTNYGWFTAATGGTSVAQGPTYTVPTSGQTTYWVGFESSLNNVQVGQGTSVSTSSYVTPYKTFYHDGRVQYLVLASELAALGASAGNINSMSFEVAVPVAQTLTDFTIKMGGTSVSAMTAQFLPNTAFTTVYSNPSYATVAGWNAHAFTTPFQWNGSDNVVVEVCFNNTSYTSNTSVYFHTTSFNSATDGYIDAGANSGCTPGVVVNQLGRAERPNMKFEVTSSACSPIRKPVSFVVSTDTAVANISAATETSPGQFSFASANSNGDVYTWTFGNGITATGATATTTYTAGGAFTVSLVVVDTVCGTTDSAFVVVNSTIGMEEQVVQTMRAYPNPSDGLVSIQMTGSALDGQLEVVNGLGQVVETVSVSKDSGLHTERLMLRHLAKGVYQVRLVTNEGSESVRLVLQ